MSDEGFKAQISIKDPAGTLYNFRGNSVEEVQVQVDVARQLPAFTAALAILDAEVVKAAGAALAAPAAVPPAVALSVAAPAVVAEAAAAAQAATPPPAAAPPAVKKDIKLKNPNAPRSEAQGKLITRLGGQDNAAYTMQQAVDYIDALKLEQDAKTIA